MTKHAQQKTPGISTILKPHKHETGGYFQSLFSTTDADLHGWSPLHTYLPGIELSRQGHPATRAYFIERGIVKLSCVEPSGEEVIVGLRRHNWLLAASAVILGGTYSATAMTLTPCTMSWISARTLMEELEVNIDLSAEVNRMLSREIRGHLTKIVTLGCMSATERLRRFLSELISEEDPGELQKKGKFDLPLKNNELAQIIAVTPQHLSRLLQAPELQGHLKKRKKVLTIYDPLDYMHKGSGELQRRGCNGRL